MNEHKMGTGTLFINHPGDNILAPLGDDFESKLEAAFEAHDEMAIQQILNDTMAEAESALTVFKQQLNEMHNLIGGIKEAALDCVREDFGGRIPHLARHGRKHKTRKKNLHRAFGMFGRTV